MNQNSQPSETRTWVNGKRIEAAVQRAVRAAVLAHARAGNPVATWRDGKVVWVQPEEILARFAVQAASDRIS